MSMQRYIPTVTSTTNLISLLLQHDVYEKLEFIVYYKSLHIPRTRISISNAKIAEIIT